MIAGPALLLRDLRWDRDAKALRRRIGVSLQETQFPEQLAVLLVWMVVAFAVALKSFRWQ